MKQLLLLPLLFISVISFGQVPNYVPTDSLVGWWGFNGNANDESGNSNDGTVNGATLTTDRFGNTNSAYDFDGLDDIIDVYNIPSINNNWTISFWFSSSNSQSFYNQNIIGLGSSAQTGVIGGAGYSINGGIPPGQCPNFNSNLNKMYLVDASSECNVIFTENYSDNIWYHITIVNNSGNYIFYINSFSTINDTANNLIIEQLHFGNRDLLNFQWYKGKIDDIGLWNRELDSCEIKDLYDGSLGNCCAINPITSQPTNQSTSIGNNATISFTDNLTGATYQWQIDAGTGYSDLSNAGQFSGTDTQTLTISSTTMSNNNTLYRCIVTESSNCMDTTDVSTLTVIDNTSINELDNSLVKLFPNPTSDHITIDIKGYNGVVNVEVYDLQGRLLETTTNNVVSLKKHAKGIYVLKVSYGEITEEVRVVRD